MTIKFDRDEYARTRWWVLDPGSHEPRHARNYAELEAFDRRPFEETRRVAHTDLGDVSVSTVFLQIDHAYDGGPPILFETMIFGGVHSDAQWRYHTWDDAVLGHAHAVQVALGKAER